MAKRLKDFRAELLADAEVRAAYEEQAVEYEMARLESGRVDLSTRTLERITKATEITLCTMAAKAAEGGPLGVAAPSPFRPPA